MPPELPVSVKKVTPSISWVRQQKSYVQYPYHYRDFWGFLGDGEHNPYDEGDLSYVKRADRHVLFVDGRYFVMLDDLEVDREQGSRFSWLYHVLQDVPLEWNDEDQSFAYSIDGVNTLVQGNRFAGNKLLGQEERGRIDKPVYRRRLSNLCQGNQTLRQQLG